MGDAGQDAELPLEAEEGRGVDPLEGLDATISSACGHEPDRRRPWRSGRDPARRGCHVGRGKSGQPGLGPHAARARRPWLSDLGARCPIKALADPTGDLRGPLVILPRLDRFATAPAQLQLQLQQLAEQGRTLALRDLGEVVLDCRARPTRHWSSNRSHAASIRRTRATAGCCGVPVPGRRTPVLADDSRSYGGSPPPAARSQASRIISSLRHRSGGRRRAAPRSHRSRTLPGGAAPPASASHHRAGPAAAGIPRPARR